MPRGPAWTSGEHERLQELYPALPKDELLAAFPGRTFLALRMRARQTGLVRQAGAAFRRQNCFRRPLSEIELAYIAGIIDGEGHITVVRSLRPRSPYPLYTPQVGVTNQSEVLIRWMDERIAWTTRSLGVDVGAWGWAYRPSLVGHGVAPLLRALIPHLVIKRRQAELIVRFCEMRAVRMTSAHLSEAEIAVVEEARSLNRRRPQPMTRLSLLSAST